MAEMLQEMVHILVSHWTGRGRILDRRARELCTQISRSIPPWESWKHSATALLCGRDNLTLEKLEKEHSRMALTGQDSIELGAWQRSRNRELVLHMLYSTGTPGSVL